ncbi:hypothetical protein DJ568_06860 [Mucilaginibacter hurinus]|uniref:Uncharacterized protein n=2 Tax=Mucilaginibacter hurinus TaxID=2201324 RepID=A0A367GQ76_9SPHI|nr:hypothetical protein DJ568_06860 [Mucilaginibacter hurinus]
MLCAAIGGVFFGKYVLNYRKRNGVMYSVFFIPIIAGIIEAQYISPSQTFTIHTSTIVRADPSIIWANIVRVNKIRKEEYNNGFFNFAGIPRPLYAQLNKDTLGGIRTGHFEEGLIFKETVNQWHRNQRVSFNIAVVPSSVRNTVFDKHVLTGAHFEFLNASYEIQRLGSNECRLHLTSSYKLNTKINSYASLWGNLMLSDFQNRLLDVIKNRCDKQ